MSILQYMMGYGAGGGAAEEPDPAPSMQGRIQVLPGLIDPTNVGYKRSFPNHGVIDTDDNNSDLINGLFIEEFRSESAPNDFVISLSASSDPGQNHFESVTVDADFTTEQLFTAAATYSYGALSQIAQWTWDLPGGPVWSFFSNGQFKDFTWALEEEEG